MGALSSFISQGWPPKSRFSVDDIPDLTGKVMIVTGGNTGLGKETVEALLSRNATVYLAARNKSKADAAIAELQKEIGKSAQYLELDLASLASVKRAAETFLSHESRLDVLFNNAGILYPPVKELTEDGYDLQFGVNVLGHFYLTKLLLPTLIATTELNDDKKARVVNTSSIGHTLYDGIHFNTLTDTEERLKLTTHELYCQSKIATVMFSNELAKRYGPQGIISTSLNPGNLKTELQRNVTGMQKAFLNYICHPAHMGALTQLWAGTSPETVAYNGKYLIPWARVGKASKVTEDERVWEQLWDYLEDQIAKFEGST